MSGSLRKEKIQGYKVKHTLYSIDDDKKLWVDLTLIRGEAKSGCRKIYEVIRYEMGYGCNACRIYK